MTKRLNAKMTLAAAAALLTTVLEADVPKLIVDTDMYTDIDSGAVALAHVLADRGECDLIGVVSSTGGGSPAAGVVRQINVAYGRPDLPVGAPRRIFIGPETDPVAPKYTHYQQFVALVQARPDLAKYVRSDDAPDSVEVYRRLLAGAPDGSVIVCTIGFLTNLRLLVESKPDAISPLSGRDLVAKKVRCLWSMACKYPSGIEYNSSYDAISSGIAFYAWPTPICFLDFDYGYGMRCGLPMAKGPADAYNPVRSIYTEAVTKNIGGKKIGHPAWDEVTVLFAVRGWERYCRGVRGRFDMVNNKGRNVWTADPNGPHLVVQEKVPRQEVVDEVDRLLVERAKGDTALEPDFWRGFDAGGDVLSFAAYGTPHYVPTPGGKGLCGYSPAWHRIGDVGPAFTAVLRCKAAPTPNAILFTLGSLQRKEGDALMLVTDSEKGLKLVVVRDKEVRATLAVPVGDAGAFHTYALRGADGRVTVTVDGTPVAGSVAYVHAFDTLQLLGGYNKHQSMPEFRHGCGTVEANGTVSRIDEGNVIDDIKIFYRRVLTEGELSRL